MSEMWRLGLDLGWNSLGWCVLALDAKGRPIRTIAVGVRLFADGRDAKTGTSLAADRRLARQIRRNRDRMLGRRARLMQALVAHGLMPSDPAARKALVGADPYTLRARGLNERLDPHEFGRVLWHLHQRRGFRSMRKGAGQPDEEAGKIETAVTRLRAEMDAAGAPTMGAYFAALRARGASVRARLQGKGAQAAYPFYPHRDLVADEFDRLWRAQTVHHPALLTSDARDAIEKVFFEQRPLKPVNPGTCLFDHPEPRAPAALPLFQRFRMWSEINNLRVEIPGAPPRRLTGAESLAIAEKLGRSKALSFLRMRKLLKVEDPAARFNLERPGRDGLDGDRTGTVLASKKLFGLDWWTKSEAEQDAFVEALLDASDDTAVDALAVRNGLVDPVALRKARLPDGHARLGRPALAKLLPHMRDGGLDYPSAAAACGYHHSDFRRDGTAPELPPYQETLDRHLTGGSGEPAEPGDPLYDKKKGRFPNPTVHIGLNQLRRVVNALIAEYGRPTEIVVELARDLKQSAKEREAEARRNRDNRTANERRRMDIKAAGGNPDSPLDLKKMRLWEELAHDPLARRCVYTGEAIGIARLFGPDIAVDHILPFAETWDDSVANQIVCLRRANERKGKRTPAAVFGGDADWPDILARAASLPLNKRWRFAPDALERHSADGGFLARQLNDTRYLSRLAKDYLGTVCDPDKIWAIPGGLTALLRGKWGLNSILSDDNRKNRTDHRHHAIDAFVVGCTDRSMLMRLSAAAARGAIDRLVEEMPPPWPGFERDALRELVRATYVSLRPDHGTQGSLHKDSAYGPVSNHEATSGYTGARRVAIDQIAPKDIAAIRDPVLRGELAAAVESAGSRAADAITTFARQASGPFAGIRRVRLLEKLPQAKMVNITRADGSVFKRVYAERNWCVYVFEQPDGRWRPAPVSMFEANRPAVELDRLLATRKGHPTAKRIMRLFKGDFVALEQDGAMRICRVVKLKASTVFLAEHHEGGKLDERAAAGDFKWISVTYGALKARKARKVSVDPIGRVRDPGFSHG